MGRAAEAGHVAVVRRLAQDERCELLARNVYGQSALHFGAQNGRDGAVGALLDAAEAKGGDVTRLLLAAKSGGSTAAEKARRAGHRALASCMAARDEGYQLTSLLHELSEPALGLAWEVHVRFDSNPTDEPNGRSRWRPQPQLDGPWPTPLRSMAHASSAPLSGRLIRAFVVWAGAGWRAPAVRQPKG